MASVASAPEEDLLPDGHVVGVPCCSWSQSHPFSAPTQLPRESEGQTETEEGRDSTQTPDAKIDTLGDTVQQQQVCVHFDACHDSFIFFSSRHASHCLMRPKDPSRPVLRVPLRAAQHEMLLPLSSITSASLSPDRAVLAVARRYSELKLFDARTGDLLMERSCRDTGGRQRSFMLGLYWPVVAEDKKEDREEDREEDESAEDKQEKKHSAGDADAQGGSGGGDVGSAADSEATTGDRVSEPQQQQQPALGAAVEHMVLIVTSEGLELDVLSVEPTSSSSPKPRVKATLKHVKTAEFAVSYHWYCAERNFVLLVNSKSLFKAYDVGASGMHKVCKFEVDFGGTCFPEAAEAQLQSNPSVPCFYARQIHLTMLYGRIVCLCVNERKGQLHVLEVNAGGMRQTHVFDLYLRGLHALSVVDNVLITHNEAGRVSLLFDVQTDGGAAIAAPLPIFFRPHGPSQEPLEAQTQGDDAYRHVYPRHVVAQAGPGRGVIFDLRLDLEHIATCWSSARQFELVLFLTKRREGGARQCVLRLLSEQLASTGGMQRLPRVLHLLAKLEVEAAALSLSAEGQAQAQAPLVTQAHVLEGVFRPYVAGERGQDRARTLHLVDVISEYVRNLCRSGGDPSIATSAFLVALLIRTRSFSKLHQFLQYHIVRDSQDVADQLLAASGAYPPAFQLALDMLFRLQAFQRLMQVVLREGRIIQVLKLVSPRSALFLEPGLTPLCFLQAARAKGPTTFFWTYKYFQARNLRQRGAKEFVTADGCEEMVAYFNQTFM
jgi:hypothetical protein